MIRFAGKWVQCAFPLVGLFLAALVALSPTPSRAAVVVHKCGGLLGSNVRTDTTAQDILSTTFKNIPGAHVSLVVPKGATRCVRVHFSLEMSCGNTPQLDACYIRMLDKTTPLDPVFPSGQDVGDEQPQLGLRSFEWVARLSSGKHIIHIQAAVDTAPTSFSIDGWTLDVEVDK